MKSNYNDCLQRLLKDEGGYSNNPNDSGGPTNYGITIADYRKYINKAGTASDVKNMTVDQAKSIYKSKYWDALDCDNLPSGVDYTCFDYGVNSGLGRPRKALQRFKSKQGADLINSINDERMTFLRGIGVGKNAGFLRGWTSRVARVRAYSLQLSSKKDNTTGPVAGTATLGIGATLSHFWHNHETLILTSAIILAILVGTAVHIYRNKVAVATVNKGKTK